MTTERNGITRRTSVGLLALIAGASLAGPLAATPLDSSPDGLETGFRDPPNAARPRVWWHWLNGNVTQDGIAKDLDWMSRSGIGGVQTFDVNFASPAIVDERLIYMTPAWRDAFRFAAGRSADLGLELTVAASPGWSETGGPWVPPKDGMKKLVWSETVVPGGRPFTGVIAPPPSVTGPFQNIPLKPELGAEAHAGTPAYYADVAVLAYPASPAASAATPIVTTADGETLDSGLLADGDFQTGVTAPRTPGEDPTVLFITYDRPQTIRSVSLYIPNSAEVFAGPSLKARLEAQVADDQWRKVSDIQLSTAPTTVSFEAVTAARYRLVLAPAPPNPSVRSDAAPGFDMSIFMAMRQPPRTITVNQLRLDPEARVNQFEAKAGFSVVPDYYALDADVGGDTQGVAPGAVIDLTHRLRPDGTLDWTPPPGDWRVLRLGYSLLGKTNHPAPPEATGLEVDKLDAVAVRAYMQTYIQTYRDVVGSDLMGRRGVNAILTDSTEVGAFNWTPAMLQHFQRLRGYDARPWLPVLTGVLVGSRAESDKFLYDFRRAITDLHATEHYGTVAEVAHENGLKVYGESLEGWRTSLGDDLDMRRYTDVPMAALWAYPRELGPLPLYIADMRGAASVAHLYGQNFVAAESMTASRYPWAHAPADLRRVVDLEFANGVNRIIVHTSVHQPVDDKQPGLSLRHIGQYFNRHETWADMARPWVDYIARSSHLLQQGRFVADVAYFYGEEAAPGALSHAAYFPDAPVQYGHDLVSALALRDALHVEGSNLVSSGGARYRLLYLGGTSARMTLPTLRRIAALVEAGATVVGEPPSASPSLDDSVRDFERLVRRLWSGRPTTRFGRGRVIAGRDVEAALSSLGAVPDFAYDKPRSDSAVLFVHRKLDDGDLYFVNNRNNRPETIEARFRSTGRAPEIWRADTGEIIPISYRVADDRTIVSLTFEPEESFFIVFRERTRAASRVVPDRTPVAIATLEGPWAVTFQPGRGAPASTRLETLAPLNENANPDIQYFSGVATYSKTFAPPADYRAGEPLLLDLGEVGDVAEILVNGRTVGGVWHAPYRLDIASALQPGDNQLEVRVANLWVNRLIGDQQPGATKIAYTIMPTYKSDTPLRTSGLIGPVRLMTSRGR